MNGGFFLFYPALGELGAGLGVLAYQVDALDDGTILLHQDTQDTAFLALAFAGIDEDFIAFPDM
jgi:hypothetical protein